jgi:hypothetical protein
MELILREIGHVVGQGRCVVMHGLSGQDPAHMSPPRTIDWRMRITFFVSMLVMDAVRGYPKYRSAFERQSCANR